MTIIEVFEKIIKKYTFVVDYKEKEELKLLVSTIKNELQQKNNKILSLKQENKELTNEWKSLVANNINLEKAIEIIKREYPIELKMTTQTGRSENYNKYLIIVNGALRVVEKEEYNLLKEVLE